MYYVIQVRPQQEEKYIQLCGTLIRPFDVHLFWPRRKLRIKQKGKWRDSSAPIFRGYVFIEVDSVGNELYWKLRNVPGFTRFLKNNQDIRPVPKSEANLLSTLMSFGEIVKESKATFDENNRIKILSGPLLGLEGRITKVDRRKGRAKVKLDLYSESYLVDFGFEFLEKSPEKPN